MNTRQLGFWMCTALVVGNTIGMGIFIQPASLAPYGLNALTGWAAVVTGCACLAIVLAKLSRRLPQADGPFGYVRATLGEPVAFAALWCYWISVWVTNAAIAVAVVGYVVAVFPALKAIPAVFLGIGFMWLFIIVNLFGARTGGRVQIATVALKLAPLLLVMVLGSVAILSEPSTYIANLPVTPPIGLAASMAASAIALFAMLGFESATIPAGRVTDPERTLPRATLVGTLIVAIIYIAIVVIGMLLVPQATLAASDAPFVILIDSLLGIGGGGRWIALFVVVSGLGALNGWTLVVGELTRTLASYRLLPEFLSQSNSHGAPGAALIVTGVFASAVALMSANESLVAGFTFLTELIAAANLPLYLCCALGLLYLSRREPGTLGRMPWLFGIGGAAFTVFAFIGIGKEPFLWALALSLTGLPVYFWMRHRHPRTGSAGATPPP